MVSGTCSLRSCADSRLTAAGAVLICAGEYCAYSCVPAAWELTYV